MLQILQGYWASRAVYAAAKLGIADLLATGSKTCDELARATETNPAALYRLLRALDSIGVFHEDMDGTFVLGPLGETLRSDVFGSLRFLAIEELGENHYPAWEQLLYSLKTGAIAFDHVYGASKWKYMSEHPDEAATFNAAMASFSSVVAAAIVDAYNFSSAKTIVDLGGGDGTLLATILKSNAHAHGILADVPHVAEKAGLRMAAEGLSDRCQAVPTDFFQQVPQGDICLLKWIIHDWDDEHSVAILRNCCNSLQPDGKVLLIEAVVLPGRATPFSKFMDLNMLVMTGGRERTEPEYRKLLEAAGFKSVRVIATHTDMSIIEASR